MINITTLQGAKDVLSQYSGDDGEYCVIGPQSNDNFVTGFGYWLVKITDIEEGVYHSKETWRMITIKIPEDIMNTLIDEGHLVPKISEKEWDVQVALGTAPRYKKYLIRNKVEK